MVIQGRGCRLGPKFYHHPIHFIHGFVLNKTWSALLTLDEHPIYTNGSVSSPSISQPMMRTISGSTNETSNDKANNRDLFVSSGDGSDLIDTFLSELEGYATSFSPIRVCYTATC